MKIYHVNPKTSYSDNTYLIFATDLDEAYEIINDEIYTDVPKDTIEEIESKEDAIKFVQDWGTDVDDDFIDQFTDLEDSRIFAVLRREKSGGSSHSHPGPYGGDYEFWGY